MKQQLQNVRDFHIVTDSHRQEKPTIAVPEKSKLSRIHLMREELEEVVDAITNEEPIENLAKELADLVYVTLGTVETFGLSPHFEEVFQVVHESNMRKLQGGAKFDKNGKVIKKSSYQKPDIKKILMNE